MTNRPHRRRFLQTVGSASAAWLLAEKVPFAQTKQTVVIEGKPGLVVLNDRPVNAETPLALLDEDVTSNASHFIRNNGLVPDRAKNRDLTGWSLTVDGHVRKTLKSIIRYNSQQGFHGHFNHMRGFVLGDESALLMATYPLGRRPTNHCRRWDRW